MFDRLTDGARKCMGLARQESQRLRHECIAPEHILLAIVLDAESTACIVLRSLQVEPARLQVSVLGRVERGDTVTGFGQVPFTPAAKRTPKRSRTSSCSSGWEPLASEACTHALSSRRRRSPSTHRWRSLIATSVRSIC